ncbi:MAG: response regulator [Chloroflexi bacterium]|nr:response regulator [Chloroflexota bacterium]
MSDDKSPGRLLVIDGDSLLLKQLQQHFEAEGYAVDTTETSQEGINLASTVRPNLILLAARMPDMAGLDVFRTLSEKPRTRHIPVMFMAQRDEVVLQNKVLEEGAYDFLEKPLDLDILTLRVRNALRRAEREGLTESRTGLPTGRLVDERIDSLQEERGWYRIDLEIEHFGVFRDLYGFVTANEALRFTGNLITQIVNEHGSHDDFIGHRSGSEHFVIISTPANGPRLGEMLVQRLNQELESFYNFMEREQGFVMVEDGAGGQTQKPLMSAQLTTYQGEPDPDAPNQSPHPDDVWVDAEEDETPPATDTDSSAGGTFDW